MNSLEGLRSICTAGLEKTTFYEHKLCHYGTPSLLLMLDHRALRVQKRTISSVHAKSYVQRSFDTTTYIGQITYLRQVPTAATAVRR